jgi:hypothetical protein
MWGYLSLAGADDPKEIPVEEPVGLYRIEDRDQQVFAEVDGDPIPLGVSDPTVSRKKDGAPVVVDPREEFVVVRNAGNHNTVRIDEKATGGVDAEIDEGGVARLRRDATIEIGYQTTLELVVERSRTQVIKGEKVVMGDEIDNSTRVDDSVVNRSNIGGGDPGTPAGAGGGTTVEDSMVNRSNVGSGDSSGSSADAGGADSADAGSPVGNGGAGEAAGGGSGLESADGDPESETRNYCETHEIAYSDQECPRCAGTGRGATVGRDGADSGSNGGRPAGGGSADGGTTSGGSADGGPTGGGSSGGADLETKYCIFCGEKIPAAAVHCRHCGREQPE